MTESTPPSRVAWTGLLVAMLLGFPSCGTTPQQEPQPGPEIARTKEAQAKPPALSWEFDGDIADGIPSTDVYLVVNGALHPVVDNAMTEYRELKPGEGKTWGVPPDRLAAATSWFAGAGDVLYVTDEGGKLGVYRTILDEQADLEPFQRIKTIPY